MLLIDRQPKTQNDRTWCFWAKTPGLFGSVVSKEWAHIWFHSPLHSARIPLSPYRYYMIRSQDFYAYALDHLAQSPNVQIEYGHIQGIQDAENGAHVQVNGQIRVGQWVFNSLPEEKLFLRPKVQYLKQHFMGWMVQTNKPVFDPATATFMDFRIEQEGQTRFMYLLPTSAYQSLVEFTVFSPDFLPVQEYEAQLRQYFLQYLGLQANEYQILEEEFGVIPMADAPLKARGGKHVVHIGTRGGQTKASTGYTFVNIQKQSEKIVAALLQKGVPFPHPAPSRFRLYDRMLLNVLQKQRYPARDIFARMFARHPIARVLRFLDGESRFDEEIKIMAKMPSLPFLRAGLDLLSKM
ncbi:MAG: lycopene cyclase [Microscillaceae bacterium]|nr:lycopene cyclase [Microscillaceae bacterium]